jgi:peptide/nickel transport system substrate-binding protein
MKKILLIGLVVAVLAAGCASPTPPAATESVVSTDLPQVVDTPAVIDTEVAIPPTVEEPVAESVVTRALTSEPTGLDPHGAAGSGQNVILPFLYDTLVYRDFDGYKPYLASDWEISEDGRTVTFQLRDDVVFHDGTAFNAEVVAFNIDRLRQAGPRSPASNGVAEIESVEVVAEFTVRFNFVEPSAILFSTLSTPYAAMVSPTAVEEFGEEFGQHPVGSGPFMMESWSAGQEVVLAANPNYKWPPEVIENQGRPYIDRVVFRVIPDPVSQINAFENNEVDVLFVNNPGHLGRLRQNPDVELVENVLNSLVYLGFNTSRPPFDDVKVRQALAHAVNKQEIVELALGGIGEEAFAPLAPTLPGHDPSLKDFELAYDPERSMELLQEAGFEQNADGEWTRNGSLLQLTVVTSTRAPNEAIATLIQSQMKEIGVGINIQQLEAAAVMEVTAKGEYDAMIWRYDWNDADVLNVYLGSDRIGRTNRQFYSNPQVDELLTAAGRELDPQRRNEMYLEAQKLILSDAPWQPLYTPKDYTVIRSAVENVVVGPMGRMLMNDARVTGQ